MRSRLRSLLRNLLRRGRVEAELEAELEATFELLVEEKAAQGLDPESARCAARQELGSLESVREQVREARTGATLETLARDVGYAARLLRRRPGFASLIVLTLALGVGAATSLFALIDTLVLRPLPFPQESRLVRVRLEQRTADGATSRVNVPGPVFDLLARELPSWSAAVALDAEQELLLGAEPPRRISRVAVTDGWQATLGVAPKLGRWFTEQELGRGADAGVAVVAWSLARDLFGDPRAALGEPLRLESGTLEIVGVFPPRFRFPYTGEVWTPTLPARPDSAAVFARLAPGVSLAAARAQAAALGNRLPEIFGRPPGTDIGVDLEPARRSLMEGEERISWALAGVAVAFLLIASLNAAMLFLARALTRRDELAMRAALGAPRSRLVGQLLAESLLLSLLGTVLGGGLLATLAPALEPMIPSNFQEEFGLASFAVDGRLLLLVVAILLASALVFGLVPSLRAARRAPAARLAHAGRGRDIATAGRLVASLIVAQVAIALAVLLGTAALGRHLRLEADRPTGLALRGLVAMQAVPPRARLADPARRRAFVEELVQGIESAPGIAAAAVATSNPLGEATWVTPLTALDSNRSTLANYRLVTPGWFATTGVAQLAGRRFVAADRADGRPVAIVSSSLARTLWPGAEAVGHRLRLMRPGASELTVIGVVDDTLETSEEPSTLYLPFSQNADSAAAGWIDLFVRSPAPERSILAVRAALRPIAPDTALIDVAEMEALLDRRTGSARLAARVATLFSGLALGMAALGLFGIASLDLRLRRRELAVRVALGARPCDAAARVVGRPARLVLLGIALGLPLGFALVHLLAGLLPRLGWFDLRSLLLAVTTLAASAVTAALWPAARALRVDPATTLRDE